MSDKIINKNIIDEMSTSFLDYAMSVIVSRALPDVRDGLKPVHRRILFAMNDLGNYSDKPYKKSARIVGDVIGKYHPHGDTAVYETMVRMAQNFTYREMLVDGHGNFGSLDGDGAAAMRYTEARMSKIAMELLRDINKNTVDFQPNYDANEQEPVVLPAKFPNLLVNGTSGIAVGMATNIPPHNLNEVINGVLAYMDNPEIEISELMQYVKGPDFPLGAQILGIYGIKKAFETGNGTVKVRSKYQVITDKKDRSTIIINEIPFQVNKASLVEKIADCVKDKRIDGISDLRDESDRDGIRIVIELKRGVTSEVVINNLFKHTQLENNFSINMLALVNGEPKVCNLKELLAHYYDHQVDVIRRRSQFELKKANERMHILKGLQIAISNIDEVLKIIRASVNGEEARAELEAKFELSEIQSKAILDMRLQKLTGLEVDKLEAEYEELSNLIAELELILSSEEKVNEIIRTELLDIKDRYGSDRRTEILEDYIDSSIDYEDLIEEEEVILTFTKGGYAKRMSPDNYRVQNRGGKGVKGVNLNDEDRVEHLIFASTHSDLLFFTSNGKVYRTRAHRIPNSSRTAKGLPIVNMIDLEENEQITNIISLKEYSEDSSLVFITKEGIGKRTATSEYTRVNKNGKRAITLKNETDTVVSVFEVKKEDKMIIASRNGQAVYLDESQLRNMGRTAAGVRIMRFKGEDDYVVSAEVVKETDNVLTITTKGFGKQTPITEYREISRGGKGVKNLKVEEKNGQVAQVKVIAQEEIDQLDILLITTKGQTIRVNAANVSQTGRNTQGVRIMRLAEDEEISNMELIAIEEEKEEEVPITEIENNENTADPVSETQTEENDTNE